MAVIIRPIMTHGILVCWPILKMKYVVKRMESKQRIAIICIILGTTSNQALNVILY